MSRELIEPVKISFSGGDASNHRMDALLLGQSLSGIARVYNAVGHLHFDRQLRSSEHSKIRVQVGPPEPGSIFYLLYMLMVHGRMAVYPELFFALAEFAIPEFIKAMIGKKTGQTELLEKALAVIEKMHADHHELAMVGQENDRNTHDQLFSLVGKLVDQNRGPLADMAAPIGKTADEIRQIAHNSEPIVIDAPIAESLRSPEEVTVGKNQVMRGTITALDLKNGTFKFEQEKTQVEYRGKITDPALAVPQNVYSHALNTKNVISITAKPTIRENGEIHKLFVSDANANE
jgi:hypothetical protein